MQQTVVSKIDEIRINSLFGCADEDGAPEGRVKAQ
jgi:hypothetical protein